MVFHTKARRIHIYYFLEKVFTEQNPLVEATAQDRVEATAQDRALYPMASPSQPTSRRFGHWLKFKLANIAKSFQL